MSTPWRTSAAPAALSEAETVALLGQFESLADPRLVHVLTRGVLAAVVLVGRHGAVSAADIIDALSRGDAVAGPLAELAALEHVPRVMLDELDLLDEAHRLIRSGLAEWNLGRRAMRWSPIARWSTLQGKPRDDDRERALNQDAAVTLLRDDQPYEALVQAAHAGRLDLVDPALKLGGMPLVTGHGYEIRVLVGEVPVWRLRKYPVLCLALGIIFNARREFRLRAVELLGVAVVAARLAPRRSADRALLRAVESVGLRITQSGDGGSRAALAAVDLLDSLPARSRDEIAALESDLRVHLGISLLYGGKLDDACAQFEQARLLAARPMIELMSLGGLALVEALRGDVPSTATRIEAAHVRDWPSEKLDEYQGSMLRIAEAVHAVERQDFAQAQERIDALWPIIETIEHWSLLARAQALVDIGTARARPGLIAFRALRERRGSAVSPHDADLLDVAEQWLMLASGEVGSAQRLRLRSRSGPALRLEVARGAVLRGDGQRAWTIIGAVRTDAPALRLTRLLLTAATHLAGGQRDAAEESAAQAAGVAAAFELRTPLWFAPQNVLALAPLAPLGVTSVLPRRPEGEPLTPRELVILHELVATANIEQIAERLHVSANTVRTQRQSLYRKLKATSRDEAIGRAIAMGLLDD
ncbi:LuxR C-terminal-related transcriptional regulator [Aeromicrobium camelliae]|nr:LuxR C-terminal-related transcriptional regulator [Aeromicrobium camelliae]